MSKEEHKPSQVKTKNVVLIIPNTRWFGKRPWRPLSYAALILTSLLKDEYNFSIIDANGPDLDEKQVAHLLGEIVPDIIMVTGGSFEYHRQVHAAFSIARMVCPHAITILGGVYATTLPEEATKDRNIDWVFMYHAEERLNKFLNLLVANEIDKAKTFPGIAYRNHNGEFVENPPINFIGNVKTMVKPDYSLVNLEYYLEHNTKDYQFNSDKPTAFILSSYGCPMHCIFCATRSISGKLVNYRPLKDIIQEIEYLMNNHGVRNIIFLDDALLFKRAHITAILNAFIKKGYNLTWKAASVSVWHLDGELLELMRKSGCVQITISVESGSQRVLREIIHKPIKLEVVPGIVKKCRELGIGVGANFVIGFPGETWDEIRQTFRFAEECDFDVAHFHIATPLPRTDLYRICQENGYLPEDFSFLDPKFFGFGAGHITTEEFTPFELSVVRAFEWDRINFSTPQKVERVAQLYNIAPEKLNEHRRQTRRKLGIHF